jgi:hypothetical protein
MSAWAADPCAVCGKEIEEIVTTWEDKVAGVKKRLCVKCTELPNACYLCSLPVLRNYLTLPDGRTLCERDARTVVLADSEAAEICEKVKADLDRQFLRFITFPGTNVTVELMDRVKIQELFKIVGNDYACPNMQGCTETKTNSHQLSFRINLLSGVPRDLLKVTCVHEYTHTWLMENLSSPRVKQIGPDATEGFCELVSYLFADAQNLESARASILGNFYTRGQIHLFREAERRYGFNEIVEWMKSGEDELLRTNELDRVRLLVTPPPAKPPARSVFAAPAAPPAPDKLVLQGVTWSRTRPMAMINGRNFERNEEGKVRLSSGEVVIRCLAIREDEVDAEVIGSNERQTLSLRKH